MLLCLLALIAPTGAREYFAANPIKIPSKQDFYEFWLDVRDSQTMTVGTEVDNPAVLVWDITERGFRQKIIGDCDRDLQYKWKGEAITTGDGRHRTIYTINGTMPGYTMVVHEGSDVHVHVTNHLVDKGVIMHFHGLRMQDNVWHDGGGKLSQCPIMPDETFTYKFNADVPGTYFYHGHFHDRGSGLDGALVILPKRNPEMVASIRGPVRPDAQYLGLIQDWYPSSEIPKWQSKKYHYGFDKYHKCYAETRTFDGSHMGELIWYSALVNGRGWHNITDLRNTPNSLPLENFHIKQNGVIAIRFVNAGLQFPLVVSVDSHDMEIVTSDGNDIKPVTADYVTIFPGERYTALIRGHSAPNCRKYFIKVQSLESYGADFEPLPHDHFTLAFLTYEDFAGEWKPEPIVDLTLKTAESASSRKRMMNCPFHSLNTTKFDLDCVSFEEIRSKRNASADHLGDVSDASKIQRFFFNLYYGWDINGKRFAYPKAPPMLFMDDDREVLWPCSVCDNWVGDDAYACKCTNFINVTLGSTVQIVFINLQKDFQHPKEMRHKYGHPMHIHGVHFYVVATGFPEYNFDGIISKFNEDIRCEDEKCNKATFAREPKLNLVDPPMKDTVPVPVGGYVVIQFKATNPGWWPVHCHSVLHHHDGMALAMKIGEYADMPPKPKGFPTCYQNY